MAFSFWTPSIVFTSAILLRVVLLFYGLFQDAYSPLKYTDIDYFVFTDAARYVSQGGSPYQRETYRYTPLLAWLLLPTTWSGPGWFSFGKVLFSVADIAAGWLIVLVLRSPSSNPTMSVDRSLRFASIWLLNPMVAAISTRGSSEGLLGVMVVALLWAMTHQRIKLAGVLLGLAVHFKIYPFIYATSITWYLQSPSSTKPISTSLLTRLQIFLNRSRLTFALTSFLTIMSLNMLMYILYDHPFLQHTYLHHLTRIDHRHNFSPYNTLLYLSSSTPTSPVAPATSLFPTLHLHFESLAFIPQLGLSAILIPLALAKKDLASTLLVQTFAFVALNKVCTSQYFLWYIIFLPFYLPSSSLLSSPKFGLGAAGCWIGAQTLWLHQAYQLEFLGKSTFIPGLWLSSLLFFAVNIWILGIMIEDVRKIKFPREEEEGSKVMPKSKSKSF